MDGQGSDTATATEGEAPEVTETTAEAVDVETLKAEIAAEYAAKVEERERDNAKLREKLRALKQADEATKLKAGEYEPLIAERDSTIEELRAKVAELEPDAKGYREWLKAETAAIAEEAKALEDADRRIVDALPLNERRAAIARLSGVRTKERPPEHPAGNPSPPAPDPSAITPGIAHSNPTAWGKIKEGLGIQGATSQLPSWAQKG